MGYLQRSPSDIEQRGEQYVVEHFQALGIAMEPFAKETTLKDEDVTHTNQN